MTTYPDKALTYKYRIAREKLVSELIEKKVLTQRQVIAAMLKIPRHLFVEEPLRSIVYKDQPLPIGLGQTISHPSTVAVMTELLDVSKEHRVLEIGTGSGYQTAILAELVEKVFSVERLEVLARKARSILDTLGYDTVRIEIEDGSRGLPAVAPFDRIIVTAGVPSVPECLCHQLKPGGKMVIPVGCKTSQKINLIRYLPDGFYQEEFHECIFVDLVGEKGWTH